MADEGQEADICREDDVLCVESVSDRAVDSFARDGFFVLPACVFQAGQAGVASAVEALENILNGQYDTMRPPTKVPSPQQLLASAGGNLRDPKRFRIGGSCHSEGPEGVEVGETEVKKSDEECAPPSVVLRKSRPSTLQIINTRYASRFLDALCRSPSLGRAVSTLCKWPGCRVAQDQAWLKPPQSGPLSFHRDTTYFDFVPKEVCTVWFAFDDLMDAAMGPLEYCVGSHQWGEHRRGSANQFFDDNYRSLCEDAWKQEQEQCAKGADHELAAALRYQAVKVFAGGCSFHNGKTWHGSGPNQSDTAYRKGMGIHFIRSDAVFQSHEPLGKLWAPYKKGGADSADLSLPDEFFPITFLAR